MGFLPRRITAPCAVWMILNALPVCARDFPLVEAAKRRDAAAVTQLISGHADVNVRQPAGATALHWAAHWDDVALADQLLRAGAVVDAADDYGTTALVLACTNGSAQMIARL